MSAVTDSVNGQVVVLTGASSGIGAATARELVSAGAIVVGVARRRDPLEALSQELGADRFVAHVADVGDEPAIRELIEATGARFGRIDVVIANAAVAGGGTVTTGDPAAWEPMLRTNVYGAAVTMHHAARLMSAQGHGHLILTSSVIGTRVPPRRNHMYAATKWAVIALAEGLRQELAGIVRVTVLEPGFVDTEMSSSEVALAPGDVARTIAFVVGQPAHMAVNRVQIRHIGQEL